MEQKLVLTVSYLFFAVAALVASGLAMPQRRQVIKQILQKWQKRIFSRSLSIYYTMNFAENLHDNKTNLIDHLFLSSIKKGVYSCFATWDGGRSLQRRYQEGCRAGTARLAFSVIQRSSILCRGLGALVGKLKLSTYKLFWNFGTWEHCASEFKRDQFAGTCHFQYIYLICHTIFWVLKPFITTLITKVKMPYIMDLNLSEIL